jgi:outer membrane protein assembly factor BamD
MLLRNLFIAFIIFISFNSCSKKEPEYIPTEKIDPYSVYKLAYEGFEKRDFFYASKKFFEAELNFKVLELAAKSAIMGSYCLYGINFYDDALQNLDRYLKKYPADKNVIYAHYLIAIIFYEQIADEKKDMEPLIKTKEKIDFFLKKYPDNEYSIDLKFKKDLIINQMAAKELYIAKYYISVQKWIPAINRLKNIVENYDQTIFIEEALHRLVEIYYLIGMENKAKKYAKILGYNYNSSKWFEQTYVILNKDYKLPKTNDDNDKDSFLKKIIKKIR